MPRANTACRIDFDSVNPPRPSNVTAQASVMDVNRQQWTATTSMLVHPADLYVGLRAPRTFVQQGEPLVVESIVADLDGKTIANREIRCARCCSIGFTRKRSMETEETNPQECDVKSAIEAVEVYFHQPKAACIASPRRLGRPRAPQRSELTLWVAGGKQPPKRDVEQETVELIPDRKEYQPGDVAEILVQSPFYPAEGVLTLRRSGLCEDRAFQDGRPSTTLRVPIEESYTPNLYVQVDLNGAAARTDDEG